MTELLSDKETLFLTIWGEARGESVEGQIAVGNVIINRALRRQMSIKEICLALKQFSCWNENDPNRPKINELIKQIQEGEFLSNINKQIDWVVEGITDGKLFDNTKGSDHYLTTSLFNSSSRPKWARFPKDNPIEIGNHIFFEV